MTGRLAMVLAMTLVAALSGSVRTQVNVETLAARVRETERAFAQTMADRNHDAFISFLADDAVFLGPKTTLRGKQAVAEGWKRFYDGSPPPFSWEPERVEVLDSGTLAVSTGPVRDSQGKRIGTFNSVWRREPGGSWKVVLDSGCPPCECR